MKTSAVCFVCGAKSASTVLHVRPRSSGTGSFFQFLEKHEPPHGAKQPSADVDGTVLACSVCHAFLNQQWESYEATKTPLLKRIYWLKRVDHRAFTGAEMAVQGEYMAQLMGLQYGTGCVGTNTSPFDYGCHTGISCSMRSGSTALTSPNDGDSKSEFGGDCDGVLDLSISPKKSVTKTRAKRLSKECVAITQNNSQTVTSEDKDIICYTCRKVCPPSFSRFIYTMQHSDDEPYFPFLANLQTPSGAMPLTRSGVTRVCADCRKTLGRQWRIYVSRGISEDNRVYHFGNSVGHDVSSIAAGQRITRDAGSDRTQNVTKSQKRDLTGVDKRFEVGATGVVAESPNLNQVFRELMPKSTLPLNDVSILIPPTPNEPVKKPARRRKNTGSASSQVATKVSPKNGFPRDSSVPQEVDACANINKPTSVCYLCGDTTSVIHTLSTRFTESSQKSLVLPFVAYLKCPPGSRPIDSSGDVCSCQACYVYLLKQWHRHEENNVPIDQRKFFLRQLLTSSNVESPVWFASCPGVTVTSSADAIKMALSQLADNSQRVLENKNRGNDDDVGYLKLPSSTTHAAVSKSNSIVSVGVAAHGKRNSKTNCCLLTSNTNCMSEDLQNIRNSSIQDKGRNKELSPKVDVNRNLTVIQASFGALSRSVKAETDRLDCIANSEDTNGARQGNKLRVAPRCFICNASYQGNGSNDDTETSLRLDAKRSSSKPDAPFFPFISELHKNRSDYVATSADGSVDACFVCYKNLMCQWMSFEHLAQKVNDDATLRRYEYRFVRCERCLEFSPRDDIKVVRIEDDKQLAKTSTNGSLLLTPDAQRSIMLCRRCFDDFVSSRQIGEDVQNCV